MASVFTAEVLQDEMALSLAHVVVTANKHAREAGVDLQQSLITITQCLLNDGVVWRISYGPKDYVGRRGGDFIVDVDPLNAMVARVMRGQ
jgi:hypothetical protein